MTRSQYSLTILAVICLSAPFGWAQAEAPVRIAGRLEIYEVEGPVSREPGVKYKVRFAVRERDPLSLPEETEVDRFFRWLVLGTLHQDVAAKVDITSEYKDFIHYNAPTTVEISRLNPRRTDIRVTLKSRERAKRDAFANGNNTLPPPPITPDHSQSEEVRRALYWYDRALQYVLDPNVLYAKADLLHRIGRFNECASVFTQLIELLEGQSTAAALVADGWYQKMACLRLEAEKSKSIQDWKELATTCRVALQKEVKEKRARFLANWFDALLVISGSRGDFRQFAAAVVENEELRENWSTLYYKLFKQTEAPNQVTTENIVKGAAELSSALGRP